MARRRAMDEQTPVAADGLPPPITDTANGKHRSSSERATRFFRTRPITSFLVVFAVLLLALITFHLGRIVGHALSHFFQPIPDTSHIDEAAKQEASEHLAQRADPPANLSFVPAAHHEHEDHEVDGLPLAADERGALVDGAADALANMPSPIGFQRNSNSRICYRKFEPGKLGSSKTLCVTDEYFFDISLGNTPIGRFKIGVFGEVVPKSAANFKALVTCSGVFADESLCFRGDTFHRVVTNFVAQGGSKATGRSIYGPTFREEKSSDHHSFLEHGEKGVISWAEYPIGSQFFILIRNEAKYLDNNHVVFGIVTDGLEVIDRIHDAPRNGEEPSSRVTITNCGDAHKKPS